MASRTAPARPQGRLAILLPGLGAVATTVIAGVELARRGLGKPIGSLALMGTARLGKRTEGRTVPLAELVGLPGLEDVAFGAWDIVNEDAWQVAKRSAVLPSAQLERVREALQAIKPRPGIHDPEAVRRIDANHVIAAKSHRARIEQVRKDIREMMRELGADRAVMVHITSTETYRPAGAAVASLEALEDAIEKNDPLLNPALLYAYAAIQEGVPFANGTPNQAVDTPALQGLARKLGVPVAGKDLKTGQTLMKTIVAPGLKARMLGVKGWFSTNILGNRDGEVLDDPDSFRSKEVSKLGVLEQILQPELYPELYGELYHKVRINYYPPRGDEKEGWDNIDIFGWLGYPMQIKIDFLCRDSILAAPLALDLALFMDLAHRAGRKGIQEWLSFYYKTPQHAPEIYPENDLFIQLTKLKNNLRQMMGEDLITHLGTEYYEK